MRRRQNDKGRGRSEFKWLADGAIFSSRSGLRRVSDWYVSVVRLDSTRGEEGRVGKDGEREVGGRLLVAGWVRCLRIIVARLALRFASRDATCPCPRPCPCPAHALAHGLHMVLDCTPHIPISSEMRCTALHCTDTARIFCNMDPCRRECDLLRCGLVLPDSSQGAGTHPYLQHASGNSKRYRNLEPKVRYLKVGTHGSAFF